MEPLQFSKYAEDCTQIIESSAEYPSDRYLVQLTRLMQIGGEIYRSLPREPVESPSPTIELALRTMQTKLNVYYGQLPSSLQKDRMFPFLPTSMHCPLTISQQTLSCNTMALLFT